MNILTLGDSFTYGEELSDLNQSWPIQLANKLNSFVVNLGRPSNSNPAMSRELVEYFSQKANDTPDLVIIGWSSPGRLEFSDIGGNFNIWPGNSGKLFKQFHPWRDDLLQYLNQYHNDEFMYQKFLHDVIFVQNFLKSHGIKYIMINTVGNEYYKNNFARKFKYYEHLIDTQYFLGWDEQEGMAEWTEGCPRGQNGHFLDDGHMKVTSKLYEYIGNLGWIS
jgi:hypothetical protein